MEKQLLKKIEIQRRKLNKFSINRNLVDQEVVEISQRLDRLLNEYQKAIANKQLSFW